MKRHAPAMSRSAILLWWVLALCLGGCAQDPEPPSYDNPFDPRNGQGMPVPDSLFVFVGNNAVQLYWGMPDNATADEFAVFRQRLDVVESEALLARLRARSFRDTGVRTGQAYAYRISAGQNGRFGPRSVAVEARPGVFSIVIAGDAPKTRTRSVTLSLSAPSGDKVRLYDDPAQSATSWLDLAPTLPFTLSPDDGDKTVYCVFLMQDGSEALPVFDSILLDTRAVILSVDFDGAETRTPGEILHFHLDAGEPGGTARVDVAGLFAQPPATSGLQLFDDGSVGDRAAGDGVYERAWVIPAGPEVTRAAVVGNFTDDVGNAASALSAPRPLSVHASLAPVTIVEPALFPPATSAASVTVRWTPQSTASDFASYQIFRSDTEPVDSTARQVGTITARTTLQFVDSDVVENEQYFYGVYVVGSEGRMQGSVNTLGVFVPNERPPRDVTLEPVSSIGPTSLSLRWSRSTDRDFAAYMVFRNETGTVTDLDTMVTRITDPNLNFWDELGLSDDTQYFYRLYVEDTGGLRSRSNEVSATTENDPPADVDSLWATNVTAIAATLNWTASTDRSFALYRLYRDEARPVTTTASTLVIEIDEIDLTHYTDIEIDPGMTYYYRLFVVDEGEAVSKGSDTIEVTTPD